MQKRVPVATIALQDEPGLIRAALLDAEGRLQALLSRMAGDPFRSGDILLARVGRIDPGLDAAFLVTGPGQPDGFLGRRDARALAPDSSAGSRFPLSEGQKVIVQVQRGALPEEGKGPKLTGRVRLTGRGLVWTPGEPGLMAARTLSKADKDNLETMIAPEMQPGEGILLRSAAPSMAKEVLLAELQQLRQHWQALEQSARTGERRPGLLRAGQSLAAEIAGMLDLQSLESIEVNSPAAFARWRQECAADAPELLAFLSPPGAGTTAEPPLFERLGIEEQVEEALSAALTLPGGGRITIEHSRAMTVIDVDSGSAGAASSSAPQKGSRTLALAVNLEAASEIARQLRLRNCGGLIAIDFIDMADKTARKTLEQAMADAVACDPSPTELAPLSRFGIMEMVRRKDGPSLSESLTRTCPSCQGSGRRDALPLIASRAMRALLQEISARPGPVPGLKLHPRLVDSLTRGSLQDYRQAVEQALHAPLRLIPAEDPDWPEDRLDLLPAVPPGKLRQPESGA